MYESLNIFKDIAMTTLVIISKIERNENLRLDSGVYTGNLDILSLINNL